MELEQDPTNEEKFRSYISYPDGRKVLFSTDADVAHEKIIELAKDDPEIRGRISISGSDVHAFLKGEFNYALSDTTIQDEERRGIMRFVMTSSLNYLFSSIDNEKSEEELKDRFEKTNYFLGEILKCKNKKLCDLFEAGLDYTAINHSINMSALCVNMYTRKEELVTLVSSFKDVKNGFLKPEDIERALSLLDIIGKIDPLIIGQAGLFHDVGKAKDRELFSYDGKFSDEQREKMKKHPEDGVNILKKCGVTNKLVLGAAHNHHRRFDNTGYPELDNEYPLTEFDLLIGLVDSFEAMTSAARGYKSHLDMKEALLKLRSEIESNPANPIFPKHIFLLFILSLGKDKKKEA